jgi:glutamate decarboxylase
VDKPNIVLPTDAHVVWEKLSNYLEMDVKWVASREGENLAREEDLAAAADENTVLIMAILGSTFTCRFYDIEKLDGLVKAKNTEHPDWHLGIHVDAASGGFVAPFATPDLKWDFRLENVVSINASGHKQGQCLAGIVSLAVWKDEVSVLLATDSVHSPSPPHPHPTPKKTQKNRDGCSSARPTCCRARSSSRTPTWARTR